MSERENPLTSLFANGEFLFFISQKRIQLAFFPRPNLSQGDNTVLGSQHVVNTRNEVINSVEALSTYQIFRYTLEFLIPQASNPRIFLLFLEQYLLAVLYAVIWFSFASKYVVGILSALFGAIYRRLTHDAASRTNPVFCLKYCIVLKKLRRYVYLHVTQLDIQLIQERRHPLKTLKPR